jgi:hypothetical protein
MDTLIIIIVIIVIAIIVFALGIFLWGKLLEAGIEAKYGGCDSEDWKLPPELLEEYEEVEHLEEDGQEDTNEVLEKDMADE